MENNKKHLSSGKKKNNNNNNQETTTKKMPTILPPFPENKQTKKETPNHPTCFPTCLYEMSGRKRINGYRG